MTVQPLKKLEFAPVDKTRWGDLVELFGERGACGGCWCMWWRLKRSEWEKNKGAGNKRSLKRIVDSSIVPGILAYQDGKPIGWCSAAPREQFSAFERSRTLKPLDDKPVWSVVCLFVDRQSRRRGVASALLKAAAKYAKSQGATTIEGYPVIARNKPMPDVFAYTGTVEAFVKAGNKVVAQPTPSRVIVRKKL